MTDFEGAIASVQEILAYRFQHPVLLRQALGAWNLPLSPEAAAARQRLEFLGDAAWDFPVAAAAYQLCPHATAGDLTRFRAAWCSTAGLAHLARQLGFPTPDGPVSPVPSERVIAGMLEATLGAMVEDGGLDAARAMAHRVIAEQGVAA